MRRFFLAALCVLAACSKDPSGSTQAGPSSPSPAPVALVDVRGEWNATFTYASCLGDRNCPFRFGKPGHITLRLTQSGAAVTGLFFGDEVIGPVDVNGTVEADGSVKLAGEFASPAPRDWFHSRKVEFTGLRADPAAGLTGQFTYEVVGRYPFEGVRSVYGGPIVSATHRALPPADPSGTWSGRFVARTCSVTGTPAVCAPYNEGEVEFLDLTLSGSGSALTGQLKPVNTSSIPMSGRAVGPRVELEGTRPPSLANGNALIRVLDFAATTDVYGRLSGRFSYVVDYGDRTTTYDIELIQVIKTS